MMFRTLLEASGTPMGQLALVGWSLVPVVIVVAFVNAFVENSALKVAAILVALACIVSLVAAHWDNSYLPEGGIRMCLDCVPILLVGNLFFNILQSTIASVFLSEACQMDTRSDRSDFTDEGFQYNGDFFRLANPISIVLVTPLLDFVIYPFVARSTGREVSMGCKVIAGFTFAIGAQLAAAAIEYKRRSDPVLPVPSHCAPYIEGTHEKIHMSSTNSFYMLAPYAMVGIGEILVNPVLQHLAYEGAPSEMKPLLQAFNLFAMGALPNAVASCISQALKSQVPNNLNDGNLPLVYFINSAIGIVGIFCFFAVFRYAPERLKLTHGKDSRDLAKDVENEPNSEEDSEESRLTSAKLSRRRNPASSTMATR